MNKASELSHEDYVKYLENSPRANDEIKNSYEKINEDFDSYICAIQEQEFKFGYRCGYEAAMNS